MSKCIRRVSSRTPRILSSLPVAIAHFSRTLWIILRQVQQRPRIRCDKAWRILTGWRECPKVCPIFGHRSPGSIPSLKRKKWQTSRNKTKRWAPISTKRPLTLIIYHWTTMTLSFSLQGSWKKGRWEDRILNLIWCLRLSRNCQDSAFPN